MTSMRQLSWMCEQAQLSVQQCNTCSSVTHAPPAVQGGIQPAGTWLCCPLDLHSSNTDSQCQRLDLQRQQCKRSNGQDTLVAPSLQSHTHAPGCCGLSVNMSNLIDATFSTSRTDDLNSAAASFMTSSTHIVCMFTGLVFSTQLLYHVLGIQELIQHQLAIAITEPVAVNAEAALSARCACARIMLLHALRQTRTTYRCIRPHGVQPHKQDAACGVAMQVTAPTSACRAPLTWQIARMGPRMLCARCEGPSASHSHA